MDRRKISWSKRSRPSFTMRRRDVELAQAADSCRNFRLRQRIVFHERQCQRFVGVAVHLDQFTRPCISLIGAGIHELGDQGVIGGREWPPIWTAGFGYRRPAGKAIARLILGSGLGARFRWFGLPAGFQPNAICITIAGQQSPSTSNRRRRLCVKARSVASIRSILKNGLDRAFLDETPDHQPLRHGNIRSQGYFH